MKSYALRIASLSILLSVVVSSGHSRELIDFRVNTDNGTAEQNAPRISVAADGGFSITWVDWRSGSTDIYLQRYDSTGEPLGGNMRVTDETTSSYQFEPAVTVDRRNVMSLVWKDYRMHGYPSNPDIFVQQFGGNGSPLGTNRVIGGQTPDTNQETPDIAMGAWGTGVVVWSDYRNNHWDIYAQSVNPDGTVRGVSRKLNDDNGITAQMLPRIANSELGWFLVVWTDFRLGNYDVFAQRLDSTGQPIGANVRITNDVSPTRQSFPDVATDGAGRFTVVWVDWRNGSYPSNPDIFLARYDTLYTPLTGNIRVNTDATPRAQREPSISSDRLGNVGIVWSDSTGTNWDVVGQMVDVDGVVRESNFTAHITTDSNQLKPDIALDGRYRYVTWVDKRNGDFDIYARVTRYNDPHLFVSPQTAEFSMDSGGALPAASSIEVTHTGYNRRGFVVRGIPAWLSVTPSAGTTPDSLQLRVQTAHLPYGEQTARLYIKDTLSNDSSTVVVVGLQVVPPKIFLQTDSVHLHATPYALQTRTASVTIQNSAAGTLNWIANETADWLTLGETAGSAPSVLSLEASVALLGADEYRTFVEITSNDPVTPIETVQVILTVAAEYPIPTLSPDTIFLRADIGTSLDTILNADNSGTGELVWNLSADRSWINLLPPNGTQSGEIALHVGSIADTAGVYAGTVILRDTLYGLADSSAVIVHLLERTDDSLWFDPSLVRAGEQGYLPLFGSFVSTVSSIRLYYDIDTSRITVTGISLNPALSDSLAIQWTFDSDAGRLRCDISVPAGHVHLGDGVLTLADLEYRAKGTLGMTVVSPSLFAADYSSIVDSLGQRLFPITRSGQITVDRNTPVGEEGLPPLPERFTLSQNHPNPFNLETRIEFALPSRSDVRIDIFNLLGHRVRGYAWSTLPAGGHAVSWNGRQDDGRVVPSGIYFYRFSAGSARIVRKMILLK